MVEKHPIVKQELYTLATTAAKERERQEYIWRLERLVQSILEEEDLDIETWRKEAREVLGYGGR